MEKQLHITFFVDSESGEAASYQTYHQAKFGDSAVVVRVANVTIAFMEQKGYR